ncbi:tRNA-Phe hydroxylase [Aureococcus anophagefferens]|nr:tRNA-Phe hydroxylase [Aureococcus anophagefferens]
MARALLLSSLLATTASFQWLVVGGGPQGVHVAGRLLREVDGLALDDVCIVDDEDALLRKWKTRAENTGMRYLRPRARIDKREPPFAPDYARPRLDVFNDHCDFLVDAHGLAAAHRRGEVVAVADARRRHAVTAAAPGGDETLRAANVVLAVGGGAPAYPAWARGSAAVSHVFDDGFAGGAAPSPGGGLGAHLALRLGGRVDVVCRHGLREQQFDTHQDWMATAAARRLMGKGPRTASGTVPAAASRGRRGLKYAIASGDVRWHEADVAALRDAAGGVVLELTTPPPAERVVLATGFGAGPPARPLVDAAARGLGAALAPCGTPSGRWLRWHDQLVGALYAAGARGARARAVRAEPAGARLASGASSPLRGVS